MMTWISPREKRVDIKHAWSTLSICERRALRDICETAGTGMICGRIQRVMQRASTAYRAATRKQPIMNRKGETTMKLSEISSKIKPRTKVLVKGQVDFSRIATKIAGEELERANQYTKFPSKDPYFKMTIQVVEPDITKAILFDAADESETTLAAYLGSRIYESKKEENRGKKFFSCTSKGQEIRVYKKDAQGKLHKVNLNGNELAPGQNIELELNFFETKFGSGVGLNAVVICDDEIKVYEGNYGVKGYEVAEDSISLPARPTRNVDDVAAANGVEAETPVSDAPPAAEEENEPVGSSSAPGNSAFDALLAQFKKNG